ncbi:MAG: DUF2225 domain-containing protein [Planctomycetota bacterium]
MTMLSEKQIKCPVCDRIFKSEVVVSTNQVGQYTDFKPVVCGVFPYPFFIHTCPSCGFSGYDDDFSQTYPVQFKEKVRYELSKQLTKDKTSGYNKYMFAAWCYEQLQRNKMETADLYLRAAWCAQDESDEIKEKEARKKSALLFEKALVLGEIPAEQRATIIYLLGELKRRLGKTEEAAIWFDKVQFELHDPDNQKWLVFAAKQQKRNPKQTMPEL